MHLGDADAGPDLRLGEVLVEAQAQHLALAIAEDAHQALDRRGVLGEPDARVVDAFGSEDHGFAVAEDAATVQRLMRVLSDREREVLRLRFEEDLTQSEIGDIVGVSQMHVSRLIRQSIARLRSEAEER